MQKKSRRVNKRQRRERRRSRKGGRLRMRMKGGLGPHDGENIGLAGKYSFVNPIINVPQFRIFTFGSDMQYNAWANLLIACRRRDVPVYILTSGNKVGIIRTLQLLELDEYFQEVLCTNQKLIDTDKGEMPINPVNKTGRHFGGMHKYHVIYKIMKENGLDCDDAQVIGCLLDDGLRNDEPDPANKICPAIKFEHVLNETPPPDFKMDTLKANLFYKLNVRKLGLPAMGTPKSKYNFTPISKIEEITRLVESGNIKIVFIDFDQTLQLFEGATQFEYTELLKIFEDNGARIIVS
jgi:hypothetical protein